jgi:hypothetical protein
LRRLVQDVGNTDEWKDIDRTVVQRRARAYISVNHAFASLDAKMFDGCAGPHLGTETAAEYITSSIDKSTNPEKNAGGTEPAIQSNLVNKIELK